MEFGNRRGRPVWFRFLVTARKVLTFRNPNANYSFWVIESPNSEGVWFVAEVRLQDGESLENALRRFKRRVQQEDIIKEVKRHSYYLKPGEKKRVKQALARKRSRKRVRRYDGD